MHRGRQARRVRACINAGRWGVLRARCSIRRWCSREGGNEALSRGAVRPDRAGHVRSSDIETALEYVITSDHGQQVSIFGSDPDQIGKLVDPLVNQVCRVNINCQCQRGPDVFPFTGRKDSAEGTLSVSDALRSFSIRSMVAAKQTETSRACSTTIVTRHKSNFISTRFIF